MALKKILLAEDDTDDQKLFHDFLAHRQDLLILPVAENGVALFDLLEGTDSQHLPDLIILDQNMPKRNGLQTLRLLKETGRFAHIPVMVYSTYADEQLVRACTALGAAAVHTKPISREGYDAMIDAFLAALQ